MGKVFFIVGRLKVGFRVLLRKNFILGSVLKKFEFSVSNKFKGGKYFKSKLLMKYCIDFFFLVLIS